jgi:hypothetical protein
MPPTTSFNDCQRFAAAITAAGGRLPDPLRHLLSAHELLITPPAVQSPENDIMDAVLDGTLDRKLLDKLAPIAASAASTNAYLRDLAGRSENLLVGAWHRAIAHGAADQILDSLRPNFAKHAAAIAKARSLFDAESSAEAILANGEPAVMQAWQVLSEHVTAVTRIAAIAAQFGCRPPAQFPQVVEYNLAENFKIDDRALACTSGELLADSGLFGRPDQGHRTSPFFRAGGLQLHTVAEMQTRYAAFAADEHDRVHSGPRGGRLIDGVLVRDPVPANPYREKVAR